MLFPAFGVVYIYIYAFSRCVYPKRLTSGYTFVLLVCVFPGNRTHALLTQCSTTEPQEHCVYTVKELDSVNQ